MITGTLSQGQIASCKAFSPELRPLKNQYILCEAHVTTQLFGREGVGRSNAREQRDA
jgi:hypothetical protein